MSTRDQQKIVKEYQRLASIYDWIYRGYIDKTLEVALKLLQPDGRERILDVACGTGELERRVMEIHPAQAIVGVDITEAMLSRARTKLAAYPHVVFYQADSAALPFPDASFDCVVTSSAFHYMRNPERVLSEFARVLTPNGRLILIDWTRDAWQGKLYNWLRKKTIPAHYQVHRSEEIKMMCARAGLKITQLQKFSVMWYWRMMAVEASKST